MTETQNPPGKNHLLFWITAPFLILIAATPFYVAHAWNFHNIVVAALLGIFCVLLALMIYDAQKFWWAARSVALLLFLLCAFYLVSQILHGFQTKTLYPDGIKSPMSIPKAVKAFLIFGLPSLGYAVFGNTLFSRWQKKVAK